MKNEVRPSPGKFGGFERTGIRIILNLLASQLNNSVIRWDGRLASTAKGCVDDGRTITDARAAELSQAVKRMTMAME